MIKDHHCPGFTDENPRYGKLSSLPAITQKVARLAFQHSWLQSPQSEAIGHKGKDWVVLRTQFPALCTKKPPTIERCRLFAEEPDLVGLISCLLFWNTCSPPFHFIIQFNSKKKKSHMELCIMCWALCLAVEKQGNIRQSPCPFVSMSLQVRKTQYPIKYITTLKMPHGRH